MNRTSVKNFTIILICAALIPVLCSCSHFKKTAVITAATEFGEALRIGDSSDILSKTEGLDREFKKSFKELLNVDNYTDEEKIYAAHAMDTIRVEINEKSVTVDKDTATCDLTFTVVDVAELRDGDFKDIDELSDAVDSCQTKIINVTAKFARIEKQWYITNFSDAEFRDIYSFLPAMPPIGRSTLIQTANAVAQAVVSDEPGVILFYASSAQSPDSADLPLYLTALFDINGTPTDEEKAFRDAVKDTMTFEVDESTMQIGSHNGSVVIRVTMADFETLAGKEFKNISQITDAVKACGSTTTYAYTCELVRVGPDWFVTNIDSEDFAAILSYKKFSVTLKSVDGTYKSTVDITDKFIAYVSKEFGISMPSDLEGRISITTTLVLKNGLYEVNVDRDAFVADIKTFVDTNIDRIIMNMLGTSSSVGLDALAKIAGYKDYADMHKQVLDQVMDNLQTINTSGLESSGTFIVNDDLITLKSANDTMSGTIDNYGVITVTSPVNDPDAKKLLGSDTVTMSFEKV